MAFVLKVINRLGIFLFFVGFILNLNAVYAKDALYIVPTDPDLVAFSRFKMKIVTPYESPQTQKIAYEFPEILAGQKNKVIEFTKVPGTENNWQANEAQALCSTEAQIFYCNIHLNKTLTAPIDPNSNLSAVTIPNRLSKDLALENLQNMLMPNIEKQAFLQVIEGFFSNEPAGILMYEI